MSRYLMTVKHALPVHFPCRILEHLKRCLDISKEWKDNNFYEIGFCHSCILKSLLPSFFERQTQIPGNSFSNFFCFKQQDKSAMPQIYIIYEFNEEKIFWSSKKNLFFIYRNVLLCCFMIIFSYISC